MIRRIAGSNSVFAALVGAEGLEPKMGLKRRRRLCGENSVHVVPVKPAAPSSVAAGFAVLVLGRSRPCAWRWASGKVARN